jgi:dTDP-4-amino-4,6-dideoxygalactose transaminase
MGGTEQSYVNEAFATNWIAPLGPNVNGFEADIQSYNHIGHAAALSSGTAALHLALILNNVGPGDLVFVQSFTFSATVNPIIYQGATPVFIDSEPGTWNMCPMQLEKAIIAAQEGSLKLNVQNSKPGNLQPSTLNLKPAAIMPVHLYGSPANMEAIMAIAEKYNLVVIEDAAESLGSTIRGKFTGTFGDMGVYSFNGNKIITTSGGGALVSNNEEQIKKARFLATQARDNAPHYQHSNVGYNYRMSNVLAGIGRGQMEVLDERVAQRRKNFERYVQYFESWKKLGFNIEFQGERDGDKSNRWLTAILIDPEKNKGLTREDVRLAMEQENIECRPLWKPMHLQPIFEAYPYVGSGVCEKLFDIGLCLPSGSSLTDADFNRIFSTLDKCCNRETASH